MNNADLHKCKNIADQCTMCSMSYSKVWPQGTQTLMKFERNDVF